MNIYEGNTKAKIILTPLQYIRIAVHRSLNANYRLHFAVIREKIILAAALLIQRALPLHASGWISMEDCTEQQQWNELTFHINRDDWRIFCQNCVNLNMSFLYYIEKKEFWFCLIPYILCYKYTTKVCQ